MPDVVWQLAAEHGVQHVDPTPGQRDHRLSMRLPLRSLPAVERLAGRFVDQTRRSRTGRRPVSAADSRQADDAATGSCLTGESSAPSPMRRMSPTSAWNSAVNTTPIPGRVSVISAAGCCSNASTSCLSSSRIRSLVASSSAATSRTTSATTVCPGTTSGARQRLRGQRRPARVPSCPPPRVPRRARLTAAPDTYTHRTPAASSIASSRAAIPLVMSTPTVTEPPKPFSSSISVPIAVGVFSSFRLSRTAPSSLSTTTQCSCFATRYLPRAPTVVPPSRSTRDDAPRSHRQGPTQRSTA